MEFLHILVAYLAAHGVIPAEVTPQDDDREKTYLQNLPDEPDRVCSVRIYDTTLPTLVGKQAGIYRVQVVMRDRNHGRVSSAIYALWRFLIDRTEPIEDIAPGYWAIFDVQSGPIPLDRDEKGNYMYSLNFPVKTKMF